MRVRGWKDLILVEAGARSCALLAVAESDLIDLILTLDSKRLKYTFSSQKLVNRNIVSYGSYNYQRTATSLESPEEGDILVYVCNSDKLLNTAKEADLSHDDTLIGELLGYPECCIESFSKKFNRCRFENAIMKMIEPYLGTNDEREYSFVMNIFARFYGQSILSHYPCRIDCEKSTKLGFKYLSCLRSVDPYLASQLEFYAKCNIVVCPDVGLWAFRENPREKSSIQGTVLSSVPWETNQNSDWIFSNERIFVRQIPGGIILLSKNGEERFLSSYVLHFH